MPQQGLYSGASHWICIAFSSIPTNYGPSRLYSLTSLLNTLTLTSNVSLKPIESVSDKLETIKETSTRNGILRPTSRLLF